MDDHLRGWRDFETETPIIRGRVADTTSVELFIRVDGGWVDPLYDLREAIRNYDYEAERRRRQLAIEPIPVIQMRPVPRDRPRIENQARAHRRIAGRIRHALGRARKPIRRSHV